MRGRSEILALTFTDKAATEMQGRVDLLVPYGQAESTILTFHAFGDQVLREFGHELGLPDAPRVIGRADQVVLLREHLFELGLQRYLPLGDPTRFLGSLADLFGRAKDAGVTPADLEVAARELAAGAGAALDDGTGRRDPRRPLARSWMRRPARRSSRSPMPATSS